MSFSEAFTISQTPLNPSLVIATDVSTGSDSNITQRRIFFTDSQGNPVIPSGNPTPYVQWALGTNPISINLLTSDTACNVLVQWLDVSNTVLYSTNTNYCFSQYNQNFLYFLVQMQSETYNIVQDSFYWGNTSIFWANVIGAINAVEIGNDLQASQACLSRASYMASQQSYFF